MRQKYSYDLLDAMQLLSDLAGHNVGSVHRFDSNPTWGRSICVDFFDEATTADLDAVRAIMETTEGLTYIGVFSGTFVSHFTPVSTSNYEQYTAQNKDTVMIKKGQVVAVHSSGIGVVLADAGASPPRRAVGLAQQDIAIGASGVIQTGGSLALTDWTEATGTITLSMGGYFLDSVAGRMSQAAPSAPGIVQDMGDAVAPDTLSVKVLEAILL